MLFEEHSVLLLALAQSLNSLLSLSINKGILEEDACPWMTKELNIINRQDSCMRRCYASILDLRFSIPYSISHHCKFFAIVLQIKQFPNHVPQEKMKNTLNTSCYAGGSQHSLAVFRCQFKPTLNSSVCELGLTPGLNASLKSGRWGGAFQLTYAPVFISHN